MSTSCVPTDATRKTGRLLRQAREQAGITQQELAERLGCSQPAISQAEAGGASLSVATLQRFLGALGYDLELGIVSRDVALNEGVPGIIRQRGSRN
jgi:transcriptional regulator with XRE-family HTH domain